MADPRDPAGETRRPSGRRRFLGNRRPPRRQVAIVTAMVCLAAGILVVVLERTGQLAGVEETSGSARTVPPESSAGPTSSGRAGPEPSPDASAATGSTGTGTGRGPATVPVSGPVSIRVSGPRLIDARGHTVRLLGYNFSGTEYACIEGTGIFDTPDGAAPSDRVLRAMVGWAGTTAVRLPLNEQCWLGLGADPRYGGTAYRSAITRFVRRLNQAGLVVIIDLHRSAPADAASREQEPMPDRDHSPDFWSSVAATFRGWNAVAFDLFNEPYPFEEPNSARAWECWRDGGCTMRSTNSGQPYVAAGMSELLARVRGAGAHNVVFLGGLHWAESLTRWLEYRPADPAGQLGASFHAYSFNNYCVTQGCYDRDLAPITTRVPLLVGEIGPDLGPGSDGIDQTCPSTAPRITGFGAAAFTWFDRHGASYTAWSWNPWSDCWSLVRDWKGTPTPVWGVQFRARLIRAHHR